MEREREEDLTTKDTNRHETGKIIGSKMMGTTNHTKWHEKGERRAGLREPVLALPNQTC